MNGWKIDIFDDFAAKVEYFELELESRCEHTESMIGLV